MGALFAQVRDRWALAALFAAIVVLAMLVNRFRPASRRMLRRVVILYLLMLVAEAGLVAASVAGADRWAHRFGFGAHLLEAFVILNLGVVALFDLALPAVSIELPDIASDLAVGAGYVVATLGAMSEEGFNASSVLGASAVVSAILALSLQSTLGNVIGGVALQLDGSIHEGDWLLLDNGRQGKVKRIRWRHTVLETRNWGTLIVPNSMLLAQQIIVMGKREGQERRQYRYWVYFNVDFRYPQNQVIDVVNEALQASPIPNVAEEPKPHCISFDFAREGRDSFVYYAVRYWLTDLAYDDPTNCLVRARVQAALRRADIPFARPTNTTFVAIDEGEDSRRSERHRAKRAAALRSVALFKVLKPEEIDSLIDHLRYAPFARNETITKQGNVAHWLYILVTGEVEMRVHGDGEISTVVANVPAPSFFGEMGLMTGEPRANDVIAVNDVECYRLDKKGFDHILRARPEVAAAMSRTLAERKVELLAAKGDLDAEAKKRVQETEEQQILAKVRTFFGLE